MCCDQCIVICLCVCVFVCLSVSVSLEPLDRSSRNFVCRSPVAMSRSSSGIIAIHYVLPVLWMTSCNNRPHSDSGIAISEQSLMSMNALLSCAWQMAVYLVCSTLKDICHFLQRDCRNTVRLSVKRVYCDKTK